MATFVELSTTSDGFIAIRSSSIDTVKPAFVDGDFAYSVVALKNGVAYHVNEVWEQISHAMEVDGFVCRAPGLTEIFG